MVIHKLPADLPFLHIYPLSDVHIGAKECNINLLYKWQKAVLDDPYGYCVFAGDLMNMGLKNSKTNVYEEVLSPQDQKEAAYEIMKPLKDKILAGIPGNHCYRMVKEVGTNPLYDVFCRLQIEERYRENACFLKVNLGKKKSNNKSASYGIVLTHGTSPNKHDKWVNGVDGADVFISGHTHTPEYKPKGKIRMDMQNETVSIVPYRQIVCASFQKYGGYALRGEYLPNICESFQRIKLYGDKKKVSFSDD